MTTSTRLSPSSSIWSNWKVLKGIIYSTTLTVPDANLRGIWVLITGSNNGIGREAAIQFAKSGANLILACRQPPPYETHPEQVVEECKTVGAAALIEHQIIEWWECDMADLSSVENLAKRWNDTGRPLDILANNAGMSQMNKLVFTKDGFEICHQVNFLSHTLLTLSLLPSIARAPSPRIICTTSCLHYLGIYDLSNANAGGSAYSNNKLYFQIWLSELQLRLLQHPDYDHIVVHGLHPGFVKTGIWRPLNAPSATVRKIDVLFYRLTMGVLNWLGIDSQQGSLAIFNAATRPEFVLRADARGEFRGGAKYFNRVWEDEPSPYTKDQKSRKEVWNFIVAELDLDKRSGVSKELKMALLFDRSA